MKSTHLGASPFAGILALALAIGSAGLLFAQKDSNVKQGSVERIKVHGKALEGNLEGDSADRDVSIYLPPSYKTERNRRYPVVYLLHGYTDNDDNWFGRRPHFISVPAVIDKALSGGNTREMIVVMPNAYTAYQGSMYSNSVTTGNWEEFIARDLVSYVDSHYRTIPDVGSRGLAGHSMGGYGTVRIGMKYPEVFSSIYVLSPCCMTPPNTQQGRAGLERAEAIKSAADLEKADFGTKAMIASAAAWSPNPKKPPLFFDLLSQNGQIQPAIAAKWAANAPLAMVDQYISNLKRLRAIAMDVGAQDGLAAGAKAFDQALTDYGIQHIFEVYEGNHTNHVADRVETRTLPFFSKTLSFTPGMKRRWGAPVTLVSRRSPTSERAGGAAGG